MLPYLLRRLALLIPTLLGILLVSFTIIQFVPGGPVERMIAQLQGHGGDGSGRGIGGGGGDTLSGTSIGAATGEAGLYKGSQGLDPEFIKQLEKLYGFDKPAPERFVQMVSNYLQFKLGDSYYRDASVLSLILEKMPVSISLGLWSTLIIYLISIPLGIRKAVKDGTPFDIWTSATIFIGHAIPSFMFAILLIILFAGGRYFDIFPLRGLVSDDLSALSTLCQVSDTVWPLTLFDIFLFILAISMESRLIFIACIAYTILAIATFTSGLYFNWIAFQSAGSDSLSQPSISCRIMDYAWHMVLPTLALVISGFAGLTMLTKNSFLDEINKQYVLTARAKGLSERRVLYGHVFRNAMLIVIAGFPAAFVSIFFTGSLLIEVIFSLDGLGLLGYESIINRDYPVVLGTLYIFSLIGLVMTIIRDMTYVVIDPRINFEGVR